MNKLYDPFSKDANDLLEFLNFLQATETHETTWGASKFLPMIWQGRELSIKLSNFFFNLKEEKVKLALWSPVEKYEKNTDKESRGCY